MSSVPEFSCRSLAGGGTAWTACSPSAGAAAPSPAVICWTATGELPLISHRVQSGFCCQSMAVIHVQRLDCRCMWRSSTSFERLLRTAVHPCFNCRFDITFIITASAQVCSSRKAVMFCSGTTAFSWPATRSILCKAAHQEQEVYSLLSVKPTCESAAQRVELSATCFCGTARRVLRC